MRPFHVSTPLVLPAADRSLGRLGPFLLTLARAQGAWPPQLPAAIRRVGDSASTDTSSTDTQQAFEAGVLAADAIADAGVDLVLATSAGDQVAGIVAAAAILNLEPVAAVGTTAVGNDWAALTVGVRDGLRVARPYLGDPSTLLANAGSVRLAHLTGLLAQSAVRRTPVLFDGSPLVCAAALIAERIAPGASQWWLAGQAPPNPAAALALADLALAPLLALDLALPVGADLALAVLTQAVDLVQ